MSRQRAFDDILDAALDAVRSGRPIEEVVASYPQYAGQLRPLLEAAIRLDGAPAYLPPTARLQANFSVVQSALARGRAISPRSSQSRPWWQRRITFATLSLPAGIFAFALMSAGGSAAVTIVATTNLSSRVSKTIERVSPSWSHAIIPGSDDDTGEVILPVATPSAAPKDHAIVSTSTPIAESSAAAATATPPPAAVPSASGPQAFAGSGLVSNVRGNIFELTANGITYTVQIDANTSVDGAIAEGTSASVQGEHTGNDRVHATRVTIIDVPDATDQPPQSQPGGGDKPEKTQTPPGQVNKTKTPPGQLDKTKTPRGNANGNGGN
jgi:hypothetical protein